MSDLLPCRYVPGYDGTHRRRVSSGARSFLVHLEVATAVVVDERHGATEASLGPLPSRRTRRLRHAASTKAMRCATFRRRTLDQHCSHCEDFARLGPTPLTDAPGATGPGPRNVDAEPVRQRHLRRPDSARDRHRGPRRIPRSPARGTPAHSTSAASPDISIGCPTRYTPGRRYLASRPNGRCRCQVSRSSVSAGCRPWRWGGRRTAPPGGLGRRIRRR